MPQLQETAELLRDKTELSRMVRRFRTLIRILAASLAIAFAWLKLRGVDFPRLESQAAATILLRASLVFWYFSWLAAVLLDTRDEEDVLHRAPRGGRLPRVGLALCLVITVLFGLLCAVSTFEQFAVFLAAYWLINVVGWVYLISALLGPAMRASREYYDDIEDLFLVEQVRQLQRFLEGHWQWWRFGTGILAIAGINFVVFSKQGATLASHVEQLSEASLISLSILLFVVLFEIWVWVPRIRRWLAIRYLGQLREKYLLVRRESTPASSEGKSG